MAVEGWIVSDRPKEPRQPFNPALFEAVLHCTIAFIRPSVENGGVDLILCRVLCRKYLNCPPPSQTREICGLPALLGEKVRCCHRLSRGSSVLGSLVAPSIVLRTNLLRTSGKMKRCTC